MEKNFSRRKKEYIVELESKKDKLLSILNEGEEVYSRPFLLQTKKELRKTMILLSLNEKWPEKIEADYRSSTS